MVCDCHISWQNNFCDTRLNPYSIGIWSATGCNFANARKTEGLNPYSIGIWSATLTGVRRGANPYLS